MTKKDTIVTPKVTKYLTIILDTATELETVLRQSVFEDIKAGAMKDRERLAPNEYIKRNLLMAALFDSAANAGINLISIQYMKNKWEKDSKGVLYDTGVKIIDGWQRTESQADINLMFNADMSATITSTRFEKRDAKTGALKFQGMSFKVPNFDEITATLLGDVYGEEDFPNIIYSATGDAKTGKTHFGFSAPDPIRIYCFNRGADFVKRRFPDKKIDVVNYHLPVQDDTDTKPWASDIWAEFYKDFKNIVGGI